MRERAQHARADRMKGAGPTDAGLSDLTGIRVQDAFDTPLHLLGRAA